MVSKVKQAVQLVKKKIQDLKKSNQNNEIKITVNNKDAKKQISQIQKQIDSLQEKINARRMKLDIITPQLDKITQDTTKAVTPDGLSSDNPVIQKTISNSLSNNKEYSKLLTQEDKLTQEIMEYNKQIDNAKAKMSQLEQETSKTAKSQNKTTGLFTDFKVKINQAKESIEKIKNIFGKIPNITKLITNNIKKMGIGMKSGLGKVLKYASALFSLRSIYSILSSSAQSWLSSQNIGAQQLSANIEYMKYAMGSLFAPVIEYVINLVFQLMKAIQSLVYAFSGINIFAKATASSMGKTAGSASKASKSLIGVHNEINNVSENSSASGSGTASPSMDLSQMDTQMSPFTQKLHDFFKPLVNSWSTYGSGLIEQIKTTAGQVGELISSVWGSFENIITNGTIYSTLQNILSIIGNIAESFANAWNNNGNGDTIIQNLANAFNNLLTAIDNVVKSEGFQEFLNTCSNKFKEITDKLSSINWQPLIDALAQIGGTIGTIALDIMKGLTNVFKWLVENPIVAEILTAIAIAISIVATAIGIYNTAMGIYNIIMPIATSVSTAFGISVAWLIAIIVAIVAIIAIVVLAIMNWDTIMKALTDTWNWICEQAQLIWNAIADFFKNLWQGICDTVTNIWNGIKDFFIGLWEGIKNTVITVWNAIKAFFVNYFNTVKLIFETIWNGISTFVSNIFNGIKNTISNVLNAISTTWSNIWNGIKTVVSNVWNGIWGTIKNVINSILGGIESFVNGTIRGINKLLRGISNVANAVGSLIGLNPINLQLSTISLPRLAKGGVIESPTVAMMGEYIGARSNPEIVTPQNIMRETFDEVLSNHEWNSNNSNSPMQLAVYVGNKKLGEILLDDLRDIKRRTGKDIEALVN